MLQALGVQPLRGRWFTEAEHGPEAEGPDPVILSYAFAQSRFGGDAALGRDLLINARPSQVVGIMPSDFRFLDMTPPFEVIVAMRLDPVRAAIGGFGFDALARLKPGVTPAEASADIQRMVPIWLDAWPMVSGYAVTREAMRTGELRRWLGRSRTTWSAASRARSGCSWARSARCCSSRAPTSRTSCSCAPMRGGKSSPCAPRSAPCPHALPESCSSRRS